MFHIPSDPQRKAELYYDVVLCIMLWPAEALSGAIRIIAARAA